MSNNDTKVEQQRCRSSNIIDKWVIPCQLNKIFKISWLGTILDFAETHLKQIPIVA